MDTIRLKQTEFKARFDEYATFVLKDGYLWNEQTLTPINACIEVLKKGETGLAILGNPGSGKTLFFEMCQRITNVTDPNAFIKISVLDVVLQFNNKDVGHLVFQKWKDRNVLFDDLGTEDKGVHFGDKVEVFEKLIQFRYDLFRLHGIKTHFTSNLSYNQLKDKYGLRCMSRLNEMCEVVLLGASANYQDLRKLKNFKGLPLVIFPKVVTEEDKRWNEMYANAKQMAGKFSGKQEKKKDQEQPVSDEMRAEVNDYLTEFDQLNKDQNDRSYSGKRFVEYEGKLMDQTEYVEYRFKESQKQKQAL